MTEIVGISSGILFSIKKKHPGLRKVSVRWIPHLLTEKEMCRKLLEICKNCCGRRLLEIFTGVET